MIVLALSTATPRCSVALVDGEQVLATRDYENEKVHAERIFSLIDEVVGEAGIARTAIERVGCDIGPGSFTGVRVGVASAKGIASALGCPLVGVGSLEAMAAAYGAVAGDGPVVCVLDAKRGEIFHAAFAAGACITQPEHVHRDAWGEAAARHREAEATLLCGRVAESLDASAAWICPDDAAPHAAAGSALPHAVWIGRLAARATQLRKPIDVVPVYVRQPDALPMDKQPAKRR